ncbi:MAG TPA: glycosyltransferase [Anaerolineaceae bacterium]|nr:glycosyltransferase [Anaerolineaceae bacterium]HPN53335.1 glycosyltransferase [Anaerolineaceae bacterium]
MRVLYFTRDHTPHDQRFLTALSQTEHTVSLLRLERRGPQLEDRALPPQITLLPWRGGSRPARLQDGPALLLDLQRVIREVQPDVIHAGPLQTCAFLAALAGFRPLVSMSWGSDLLRDADHSRAWRWATRFTLSRSDVLVGDCDAVRRKAGSFGFPAEKVALFPWGVDLQRFAPGAEPSALRARLGWEENFVILSLRSWEPLYGVEGVVRAFIQASRQNPDLRLLLLGAGSQAALLHEMVLHAGLVDRVHFGGQVSQTHLPDYYKAADLYVSASHSDGSSVSLMEALASGLPVLVSDIPGNLEWITPGAQGWLFPDGDTAALAAGLLQAAADPARLVGMRSAARALAEARADWNKNFKVLLQAYEMARAARR